MLTYTVGGYIMKDLTTINDSRICFNLQKTNKALAKESPEWRDPKYLSIYDATINSNEYEITACRTLISLPLIYENWDHIIIRPKFHDTPSYLDMVKIANIFFSSNEYAMQVIPSRKNYVNVEPYTLHLWNLPTNDFDFHKIYHDLHVMPFVPLTNKISFQFILDQNTNGALAIAFKTDWPTWNEIVKIKEQILGTDTNAVIINRSLRDDLTTINNYKVIVLWLSNSLKLPAKFLV